MLFLSIMQHYLLWHYTRAFSELFHVWLNFLWFTMHFFSVPQLLRSWIAPWKRITQDRGEKWNLEDLAGFVIIGFISRLIGFILRTIIMFLGLIALTITIILGAVVFVFWVTAPVSLIGLLGYGLTLLIA